MIYFNHETIYLCCSPAILAHWLYSSCAFCLFGVADGFSDPWLLTFVFNCDFYSKNYVSPDHASLVLLIYLVLNFLVGIYHLEFTLSMFISFWELSQLRSTRPCSFFFSHYCTSLSSPGHTCCPRSLASQTYQWEGWWNIIIWPMMFHANLKNIAEPRRIVLIMMMCILIWNELNMKWHEDPKIGGTCQEKQQCFEHFMESESRTHTRSLNIVNSVRWVEWLCLVLGI